MTKTHTTITLDPEVQAAAAARNINISEASEAGIRSALNMEEQKEKIEKGKPRYSKKMQALLEVITDEHRRKCTEAIQEDTSFTKGWTKIFKDNYGLNVTAAEIIKVFGKNENKN